jgi:ribonuclease HI
MKIIQIYTDGACSGNPGAGGYGIVMKFNGRQKTISEGFRLTTNNRMELLAVIVALEKITTDKYPVEIYSDTKYVIDSITKGWVFNWIKKSNFSGKKNEDLWRRFIELEKKFDITYYWVKGHNGHPENELCDKLAVDSSKIGDNIDKIYEANIKTI